MWLHPACQAASAASPLTLDVGLGLVHSFHVLEGDACGCQEDGGRRGVCRGARKWAWRMGRMRARVGGAVRQLLTLLDALQQRALVPVADVRACGDAARGRWAIDVPSQLRGARCSVAQRAPRAQLIAGAQKRSAVYTTLLQMHTAMLGRDSAGCNSREPRQNTQTSGCFCSARRTVHGRLRAVVLDLYVTQLGRTATDGLKHLIHRDGGGLSVIVRDFRESCMAVSL